MNKDNKEEVKTCRHYRYLLPNEHANEMALGDPEYCELCYPFLRKHYDLGTDSKKKLLIQTLSVGSIPMYSVTVAQESRKGRKNRI